VKATSSLRPPAASAERVQEYLADFMSLLRAVDPEAVARVVDLLREARDRGSTVFVAGNGGSAATASHLANDLGKAAKSSGRRPFRVLSLTDNVPWLTALANDEGYERVFAGQMENFCAPGDVLILLSASGNSPNLLAAAALARRHGVRTIGLLGFDGGELLSLVDEALWIETRPGLYGLAETIQALLCDVMTTCLAEDVAPEQA